MSDGIAPAIDKVGEPEPKAPEAQANAPTMDTTAPTFEEKKSDDQKPEEKPEKSEEKSEAKKPIAGAELGHKLPKPVEVTSVPQTPLNNQTPAGGTPRPELKIDEEPKEKPEEEAQVILGPAESDTASQEKTPAELETNGTSEDTEVKDAPVSETPSESTKRKLDEQPTTATTNGDTPIADKESNGHAEKKARVEDAPEPTPARPATNGKVGRPKKDKKAAPIVGRTARKTRSQGPVEALGV